MAKENYWLREIVANYLQEKRSWGCYCIDGVWIRFPDLNIEVLTKYSKYHKRTKSWFFGIQSSFYRKLEGVLGSYYLAFILPYNNEIKLLILDGKESKNLMDRCGVDGYGEKKVSFRINKYNHFYIGEWKEFPLESRIELVGNIKDNDLQEYENITTDDSYNRILREVGQLIKNINTYITEIKETGADAYLKEDFDLASSIQFRITYLQQVKEQLKCISSELPNYFNCN